MILIALEDSS
jgi:hypothetical protein